MAQRVEDRIKGMKEQGARTLGSFMLAASRAVLVSASTIDTQPSKDNMALWVYLLASSD